MVTAGAVDEDAPPEPPTLTPSVIVLDPAGRVSLDWTVFATDEEVEKYLPFDLGLEVELVCAREGGNYLMLRLIEMDRSHHSPAPTPSAWCFRWASVSMRQPTTTCRQTRSRRCRQSLRRSSAR